MRFHSTPESALNGEITELAIIECIVSVAIYLTIGFYFGTFRYLAVAVVVAPLMLFRTENSLVWGLEVYGRFFAFTRSLYTVGAPLRGTLVGLVVGPVLGATIRFVGTLYWALRRPIQTLREMPQNWLRQALCTDFFHAPEILPLEALRWQEKNIPTFERFLSTFPKKGDLTRKVGWLKVGWLIVFLPFFLIGYLPSLIYRISFKATAVAYLPFIWVAHTTLRNPMPVEMRLERITKGELEKVRRVLSWGIIATLAAKLGFVLGLVDWSRIAEKFPSEKIVQSLVVPSGWPWWQITLGADALLTFFLLFFADAALARLNTKQAWREQTILGAVSMVSYLRATMGLITISHFFRIALVAVAQGPLHQLLAG